MSSGARAAEKLNETRNYLIEQRRTVEMRIADLERETGQIDGCREQLTAAIQHAQALGEPSPVRDRVVLTRPLTGLGSPKNPTHFSELCRLRERPS